MGFYDATVMARDEYGERLRCLVSGVSVQPWPRAHSLAFFLCEITCLYACESSKTRNPQLLLSTRILHNACPARILQNP